MPARASPLYQAKKPTNIETDARYSSAAPLARSGCGGLTIPETTVSGREIGNARTTTQPITFGVADSAEHQRGEQQQVGRVHTPDVAAEREGHDSARTRDACDPEEPCRPLAGTKGRD